MASLDEIALFEKFSEGKLEPLDSENFQKRLNGNAAFKKEYEKYLLVLESVKRQQKFKKRIAQYNEWYKAKDRFAGRLLDEEVEKNSGFPLLAILITAVVSIGLTALLFLFFLDSSTSSSDLVSGSIENNVPGQTEVQIEKSTDTVYTSISEASTPEVEQPEVVQPVLAINTFMISQEGYFLTQYSKIKDAKSFRILTPDSLEYKANLVHFDSVLDLAVLKIDQAEIANKGTLVFRLATTLAGVDTEVMAVVFHKNVTSIKGKVIADENSATSTNYTTDIEFNNQTSPMPIISKNGNIIGIGLQNDEKTEILKSLVVVAWLHKAASNGKIPGLILSTENRLSGLESNDQLRRLSPFIGRVLLFY